MPTSLSSILASSYQGATGASGPQNIINATDDTTSPSLYPVMVAASGSSQTAKVRSSANSFVFNASSQTLSCGSYTTSSGQYISTRSNNAATGSGQIYLNGATGNRIDFNTNGVAAPTNVSRSAGTKIVLWPAVDEFNADYAFGMESGTLWSSVAGSGNSFKWYAATTSVATLSGTGNFSVTGNLTVSSGNATGGGIILSDDGDIVDLNDGFCSMRFSTGVRVYSGNKSGSAVITLSNSGNITATGNVSSSSDIKLKTNIKTISNSLEKVCSMRGVEFDRSDLGGIHQVGVIAQEIEEILPEVVSENEGIKSVSYGNIVALLIEAMKEQQDQINNLKEEIKELRNS